MWGVARASVYLCCNAAVPSCALVCSVLTSCHLKMCHLARRPNRGDSKHRTRPGEHRRRTNLRNCQHPSVLVSCGCAADVCDLCLVTFWANRAFTADHQRESARCVQHTEKNCGSGCRSTVRVRHGQNHAHDPVFARVATQTAPRTSPGSLCIFGFSSHKLSLEASFGPSLVEVAKLARAPGAHSTVERLHRHGHVQAERLLEESTVS